MNSHAPQLDWIDTQYAQMRQWVTDWANINPGTGNRGGRERWVAVLRLEPAVRRGELKEISLPPYSAIDDRGEQIQTPLGKALSIVKRPEARLRVFLCI